MQGITQEIMLIPKFIFSTMFQQKVCFVLRVVLSTQLWTCYTQLVCTVWYAQESPKNLGDWSEPQWSGKVLVFEAVEVSVEPLQQGEHRLSLSIRPDQLVCDFDLFLKLVEQLFVFFNLTRMSLIESTRYLLSFFLSAELHWVNLARSNLRAFCASGLSFILSINNVMRSFILDTRSQASFKSSWASIKMDRTYP